MGEDPSNELTPHLSPHPLISPLTPPPPPPPPPPLHPLTDFLPTTKKELELRGWDSLDVILFSGDAYVDHPSFGAAVIGRVLEAHGYRVAIVPQPDWHGDFRDFKKLGRPRLFFGISPGMYGLDGQQIHRQPPPAL